MSTVVLWSCEFFPKSCTNYATLEFCLFMLQPLDSAGVAKVVASNNNSFKKGDIVSGLLQWANYTLVPEGKGLTKIDNTANLPWSCYLGVLGMSQILLV